MRWRLLVDELAEDPERLPPDRLESRLHGHRRGTLVVVQMACHSLWSSPPDCSFTHLRRSTSCLSALGRESRFQTRERVVERERDGEGPGLADRIHALRQPHPRIACGELEIARHDADNRAWRTGQRQPLAEDVVCAGEALLPEPYDRITASSERSSASVKLEPRMGATARSGKRPAVTRPAVTVNLDLPSSRSDGPCLAAWVRLTIRRMAAERWLAAYGRYSRRSAATGSRARHVKRGSRLRQRRPRQEPGPRRRM
jgi:hypothetical protein